MGRPVIATRWGGPADYLNADCGILLEPSSREALVEGFARSMNKLSLDRAWARRLGEHGRQRAAEQFDWTKKVDRILEVYWAALGSDRCRKSPGHTAQSQELTTAPCSGDSNR
jgi:glycosyltransferase involved in cell wall biosynthesis